MVVFNPHLVSYGLGALHCLPPLAGVLSTEYLEIIIAVHNACGNCWLWRLDSLHL